VRSRLTLTPRPPRTWLVALALAFGCAMPAAAYIKFGIPLNGQTVTLKWKTFPVRYFVSNRLAVPGVTVDQFDAAIGRAFATWQAVPTSAITYQRVGFTNSGPDDDDGATVLGFASHPEQDRVLGATSFTVDGQAGSIVEADIFFNAAFPWSVAANGETGRFDLESIALHEIGHLTGLGHSALGETELQPSGGRRVISAEAVMFPIAFSAGNTSARTLRADDIAGASDLYPDGTFAGDFGSVSGRVTKNGQGLFGAHIVAFNLRTKKLVGNFSLNANGDYVIGGLDPGPCIVRVEPLDDGDLTSFFNSDTTVDLDFRATYSDQLAIVPRGGNIANINIAVQAK
jgi:hypothetical protein